MTGADAEILISEFARDGARAAKDAGLNPGSYAFGSFLKGQWQVLARQHPELKDFKIAFLGAAGVRIP